MRRLNNIKLMFIMACVFQTIMSLTILFMPWAALASEGNRVPLIVVGLVFWICFAVGYISTYWCMLFYKKGKKDKGRIGICNFFVGIPGTIADTTLILSVVLFIIVNFTAWKNGYIAYVLLFLILWSANMHCMLNGKIYKYIKK